MINLLKLLKEDKQKKTKSIIISREKKKTKFKITQDDTG